MMIPRVSHVEWLVSNLARSEAFYSALFGWRFAAFSTHYRLYTPSTGSCVGLLQVPEVTPAMAAPAYIEVDDIEVYLERACELGGSTAQAPTLIPEYGRYAQLSDLDGNRIGLFQKLNTGGTTDE